MALRGIDRRLARSISVCLLLSACATYDPQVTATAEPADTAGMWRATVLIENGRGHGTGVVIGKAAVLTAFHVVDEGAPEVEFLGGERARGTVSWSSPQLDLAILQVGVPEQYRAPALFCGELRVDQKLVVIGHPLTTRWVSVEGHLGEAADFAGRNLLPLSFDLSLGNSGGPVFDDAGRVVGIASAILVNVVAREIAASPKVYGPQYETGTGLMLPASQFCDQLGSE